MPGRRPKPTRLKLLEGTQRADRIREDEPVPPEGAIIRPAFLKYREAELWDEYEPILLAMGTLSVADVPLFATWCVKMAQFEEEKRKMKAADITQMRQHAADLGMGASARAKIGSKKAEEKDPARKYFKPKTNAG